MPAKLNYYVGSFFIYGANGQEQILSAAAFATLGTTCLLLPLRLTGFLARG